MSIFSKSDKRWSRYKIKTEILWRVIGYIEFELLIKEKCWNGLFGNV